MYFIMSTYEMHMSTLYYLPVYPPFFDLFSKITDVAHVQWPKASYAHATMPVARDNSNHTGEPMNIQQPCEPAPTFYGVAM
jgi:hypothetical protein